MRQFSTLLVAALAFGSAAVAQQVILAVRTSTVIQCVTVTPGLLPICAGCAPIPTIHPPTITGGPICVEIEAPECKRCGCNACTQTVKYTTEYDAFCSTGITRQKYEVTETYKGVPAKPTIPPPTSPWLHQGGPDLHHLRPDTDHCHHHPPHHRASGNPTAPTAGLFLPPLLVPALPVVLPALFPALALALPLAALALLLVLNQPPNRTPRCTVITVVTADSRTVVPLAVGYAALLVSAFAMTAFFL
ncbi:hypothetical protein ColKHC_09399 [Colletotrichum higginsianum]|nr:hypothetical protein ColKHC_09399 [Colletotrichum higginsianum]